MGHLSAMAMAEAAPPDLALHWHLQSNHFPPIDPVFIPVAKQAIDAGIDATIQEDFAPLEEVVTLPNGLEKTLGAIAEELHLDAFIDQGVIEALEGEES